MVLPNNCWRKFSEEKVKNRQNLKTVAALTLLWSLGVVANAQTTPISLWTLDEGGGTTASDSVGSNDGTMINGPTWGSGVDGGCVEFEGSNDYIEIPDDASLDFALGNNFSIVLWFRVDRPTYTIAQDILNKRENTTSQTGWHVYYESRQANNNYRRILLEMDKGTSSVIIRSNTFVDDGQWHYCAITRQGITYSLYVDGDYQAAYNMSGYDAAWGNSAPLRFGANESLTGFFDGAVDEVAIYGTALSAGEINHLYQDGFKKAYHPNPANETVNIVVTTNLGWSPYYGAATQAVYFGTVSGSLSFVATGNGSLNGVSNAQIGGPLDFDKDYYWRVDTDGRTGDEWNFTTHRPEATTPSPSDGQYAVDVGVNLGWTPDAIAISQDVFFGTVSGNLSLIASGDGSLNGLGNVQIGGPLNAGETYYWRIDTNGFTGDEWEFTASRSAGVIYVDANRPVGGLGYSWADAYNYLQDALEATCSSTKPVEIHVAQGIYKPDHGAAMTPGDREASFQLLNDVTIQGGYAGYDQINPEARNVRLYETILSGDLNGNDVYVSNPANLPGDPTRGENSYHVVTDTDTNSTMVLDGFTITAGNADGTDNYSSGAGIFGSTNLGNGIIRNCTLTLNSANDAGGGILNKGSKKLIACRFIANAADCGGGMENIIGSRPTLIDCTFINNYADNAGAIHIYSLLPMELVGCGFFGNTAVTNGGALETLCIPGADLKYTNCIFSGNQAGGNGGAYYTSHDFGTFSNCTFSENSAGGDGGAIYVTLNGQIVALANSILWGNTAVGQGPQIAVTTAGCVFSINYCDIQGGDLNIYDPYNVVSWDAHSIDSNPLFVDADGPDNIVGTEDDDLHVLSGSPCIDAGDNTAAPEDAADLDGDSNTSEPVPWDRDGNPRFVDDPEKADTGSGTLPIVDMGAYEARRYSYVDAGATGTNNGDSWENAYHHLQDGLSAAKGGWGEIRVAQGTYKPDIGRDVTVGDRSASFQLKGGVNVIGGYAGCGEANPDIRHILLYETILSGDLSGNDVGFANNAENCYHVVKGADNVTLDGFTIIGGNANGGGTNYYGGGLYNASVSPTISRCTFKGNWASSGGGIYNSTTSQPIIKGCLFYGNTANNGGGLYNARNNAQVVRCTFSSNTANYDGGGIYSYLTCPLVNSTILYGNTDSGGSDQSAQLYPYFYFGSGQVKYTCVQGWTGSLGGTGNIASDPCFVDAGDADYHLHWSSACINVGDPAFVPASGETDIDGEDRVRLGRVDIGVDEAGSNPADVNEDGRVDLTDLDLLSAAWLTISGRTGWDARCDIFVPNDNLINLPDFTVLADFWLWQANWYEP
jgi:predicted outer membrane repeat protein